MNADKGFFLNGRYYDLHGVSMHQDWLDRGWAITDVQRNTNFILLKEIGATAVRLSHYEHNDQTYQLADQNGIILWTEIPLVNRITESPAFYANAKQQLIEFIRQRYNHPSVICWGVFNEITMKPGPKPAAWPANWPSCRSGRSDPSFRFRRQRAGRRAFQLVHRTECLQQVLWLV